MTELTVGEKLVGKSFNPSGNEKVDKAKDLLAQAADLLVEDFNDRIKDGSITEQSLYSMIHHHAMGEILNAQMSIVKAITFK
jgi:hypothetical protein